MKFQTMTSDYEISKEADGKLKLEKLSVNKGHPSRVSAGRVFIADKADVLLFKKDGLTQLLFGDMNTSHIENSDELEAWLNNA